MSERSKERIELKCRIDPSYREPCIGGCDHLCQRLVRESARNAARGGFIMPEQTTLARLESSPIFHVKCDACGAAPGEVCRSTVADVIFKFGHHSRRFDERAWRDRNGD